MQAAASPSQAAALDPPRPTRTPGQSKRDKRAAARAAASFTIPRSRADLEPHQLHVLVAVLQKRQLSRRFGGHDATARQKAETLGTALRKPASGEQPEAARAA